MADGAGTPWCADEGYFSPQQLERVRDPNHRPICTCPPGGMDDIRHDEGCPLRTVAKSREEKP